MPSILPSPQIYTHNLIKGKDDLVNIQSHFANQSDKIVLNRSDIYQYACIRSDSFQILYLRRGLVASLVHSQLKIMNTISGENSRERSRIYREQIVTVEDLNALRSDLLNEIKKLLRQDSDKPGKKWLRSSEVKKMLGISNGTLQNFRVNGVLPFTKVGGIMFYSQEDIVKLLQENSTSRGNR